MIAVEDLQRSWGVFSLALTLHVPDQGYLVVLGPSGCGKSLLLGTIAGIFQPDSGRILLGGKEVTHAAPEDRQLGFIFQRSSLFPHLSVLGNVEFGLKVRSVPRADRQARVEQAVSLFGLEQLVDRPVPSLSGGEAQRVAIARALVLRPKVLLLDEPLSLVDHNARLELQDHLRRLHAELGFTAIHVTHNREEARALGQSCAVMLGGRIVQEGLLTEVFEHPCCFFVSRFLGVPRPELADKQSCSEVCLAGTGQCDRVEGEEKKEEKEDGPCLSHQK